MKKEIKQIIKQNYKNGVMDITIATMQLEDLFNSRLKGLEARVKDIEKVLINPSLRDLANIFGVSHESIRKILSKRRV